METIEVNEVKKYTTAVGLYTIFSLIFLLFGLFSYSINFKCAGVSLSVQFFLLCCLKID